MTSPLVSICCLTFNHVNFIRQCLDGFMLQKCEFEFEVLIHDDASTDATVNIIHEYENKFPQIIKPIYQIENQYSKGIKPTFAYNLPRAKGKYIAFCEGDDYWTDPLKLQKQVDFLEKNESFVFCGHDVAIRSEYLNSITDKFEYKKSIIKLKDCIFGPPTHTSSWVFKKIDIPEKIFKSVIAGDDALMCFLASKGDGYYLQETMGVYRLSDVGTWSTFTQIEKDYRTLIIQLWIIQNYPVKLKDQVQRIYYLVNKTKQYKGLFTDNFSKRQKLIAILSINYHIVLRLKDIALHFLINMKNKLEKK
jgi:glycosyltransferase involved in cell wall biosynthesis